MVNEVVAGLAAMGINHLRLAVEVPHWIHALGPRRHERRRLRGPWMMCVS